jgi:hypothetical protein
MPRRHRFSALLLLLAACAEAPAPYLGEWTPDASQTDVTQLTATYEAVDSMTYRATMDNQTFELRMDGTELPTPWGGTIAVRPLDSLSWESVMRVNNQVISTDTMALSADGQTLTMVSHNVSSGTPSRSEMAMARVSGGPGLAGVWRASSMTGAMLGDLSIAAEGDSALDLRFSAMNATCSPPLSGADAPATSPMFDGTWTCAVTTDTTGGLSMSWKRNGELRYTSQYTVSANGDTLTEVSSATGANEPVRVVYTRKAATP